MEIESQQKKAFHALSFGKSLSVFTVQSEIRRNYHRSALTSKFQETGYLSKDKNPGQPSVSAENVERVQETFLCNPKVYASREFGLP